MTLEREAELRLEMATERVLEAVGNAVKEPIAEMRENVRRQARREALEEAENAVCKPIVRMPNEPWPEYLDRRRDAAISAIRALMERED